MDFQLSFVHQTSFNFIPCFFIRKSYFCWWKKLAISQKYLVLNSNSNTFLTNSFIIPTKPGLAKRLASNLETLAPEEVATAAQSLVALRHAPTKLMEATEKVTPLWEEKILESFCCFCFAC